MHTEIDRIQSLTPCGMWYSELNELEEAYQEYKAVKTQRQGSTTTTSKKGWGKRKRVVKKKNDTKKIYYNGRMRIDIINVVVRISDNLPL